jgi:formylglycine-generating enzyme required for sulfatase activity
MVVVPAGQFLMGSPNDEEGHRYWENLQRKV